MFLIWPIKIHRPQKNTPYVTYGIIMACIAVYIIEAVLLFTNLGAFELLLTRLSFNFDASALYTWFTAMFLHGDPFHILGNMYFLYLFGSLVEDVLGPKKYVIVYFLSGLVGSLLHGLVSFAWGKSIPAIGASGAIMGLVAISMMRFRKNKITFGWFFLFRWGTFQMTAFTAVLIYFVLQLVNGLLSAAGGMSGQVAYWGHLGGFLVGFLSVYLLKLDEAADSEHLDGEAESYMKIGDFNGAARKLETLIMEEPKNAGYQHRAARAWHATGERQKAIMRFTKGFDLYLKQGKNEEASQVYADFLAAYPDHELGESTLKKAAVLCENRHKYQAAYQALLQLVERFPASEAYEEYRFRLAMILAVMGNEDDAIKKLQNFIADFPQSELKSFADAKLESLKKDLQRQGS